MFRLQRVDQEQGLVKVLIIIIQVFRIQFQRQTFRVHSSPLDQVYNLIYFAAFHPPHPHNYPDHIIKKTSYFWTGFNSSTVLKWSSIFYLGAQNEPIMSPNSWEGQTLNLSKKLHDPICINISNLVLFWLKLNKCVNSLTAIKKVYI